MRLLLLLVFVLQLLSWGNLEGYQLADSVEYMERAQALVRGEQVIDSVAIRSFGFVSLFAPLFALADLFGVEDFRPVVGTARLLQMLLGLALLRITVVLGSRLAGRRAGLAAGLVVGLNPYFLLYSVSPVSGIAAGLCIGHALNRLIFRSDLRDSLIGGMWLGGALLVAYKTVLIALPLLGILLVSDRFTRWRSWVGASTGYAIGVLATIGLDKICYGVWGQSIELYMRQNFGQIATRISLRLGFFDLATWFWEFTGGGESNLVEAPSTIPRVMMNEPNALYHLTHLNEMVVWPLLVLAIVALAQILRRGKRSTRIVAAVFFFSLAAVSMKKSTDFRLLLPTLSCIGVLCGIGWQALFGERLRNRAIALTGVAVIVAGGITGWARLGALNDARFSGYWRAMDRINQLADSEFSEPRKFQVACAWHWAVFLRESSGVELIKLPHQLDRWPGFDAHYRRESLEALSELDAFITHIAVLLESPELFRAVNEDFEVDAVLYNREVFESLGPIVIFKRRTNNESALTFLNRTEGVNPENYFARNELNAGLEFAAESGTEGASSLKLLGRKYEPLAGDGHGWLSLHWMRRPGALATSYLIRPRILTQAVELPWEEQHQAGRSLYPFDEWKTNEIISEGWPVVAAVAPFDPTRPWLPLYPSDTTEATYPAAFWLRVLPLDAAGSEDDPLRPRESAQSERAISDGFIRVAPFELLVPQSSN